MSPQPRLSQHGKAVDKERRTTSKIPKTNKNVDDMVGHLKALDSMLASGPLEVNKEKGKKRVGSGTKRKQENSRAIASETDDLTKLKHLDEMLSRDNRPLASVRKGHKQTTAAKAAEE